MCSYVHTYQHTHRDTNVGIFALRCTEYACRLVRGPWHSAPGNRSPDSVHRTVVPKMRSRRMLLGFFSLLRCRCYARIPRIVLPGLYLILLNTRTPLASVRSPGFWSFFREVLMLTPSKGHESSHRYLTLRCYQAKAVSQPSLRGNLIEAQEAIDILYSD